MDISAKFDYCNWLYNRYVEETLNSQTLSTTTADHWALALQKHLEINLNGRGLGIVRQHVRGLLRRIRNYQKDGIKYRLEYTGKEAAVLQERDKRRLKELLDRWEKDDQRVSRPAQQTEIKALQQVVRVLAVIENFQELRMSSLDDAYVCGAGNQLMQVLRNNGYNLAIAANGRRQLLKASCHDAIE